MSAAVDNGEHKVFDVAIVGAGFSGMGMAIKLAEEGRRDFVVLERAPEVGGTWHFNTYPGCACDIPSHLYSYSFAPNPDWSETYSKQPEIRSYLERIADRYALRPRIRFNTTVEAADWNEGERLWEVRTDTGPVRARVVIAAMGPLAEPKFPDIPGLESFEGQAFHSAQWNHDWDPKGKRVASIGTGASAIQYVPELQRDVERLFVFQRTPPWVMPHGNRRIRDWERRLYRRSKVAQRLMRGAIYAALETRVVGFTKSTAVLRLAEAVPKAHMRKHIEDPELRAKLTPDYRMGCKRILPSNDWYPAIAEPNVELVTAGIAEVRPRSILDADGVEREVDAIVFGTGFAVTDMPVARQVRGRDGRTLDELWEGSPRAHLGTAIAGYPNFFLLLGPNTGLGHNSMVYMIESQLAHVMQALRALDASGADTVEVRREALERYNAEIERGLDGTVWETGCTSWYQDSTGRNSTIWPDWTWRFRRRVAAFDPSEYELA